MRVLMIDNLDSFTFNLVDALSRQGCDVRVLRNTVAASDAMAVAGQGEPALIVVSPGPGDPASAGCCLELVRLARDRVPLFGVCLGHQALIEASGGKVCRAPVPVHGKASLLRHDGTGMFAGLPDPLPVGRYHSLCTPEPPPRFHVHARIEGMAMAVSDRAAGQWGVQFHPESILTPEGEALLANLLGAARAFLDARPDR